MRDAFIQSRHGDQRSVRAAYHSRLSVLVWLLASILPFLQVTRVIADIGQAESPEFWLDTRWDYQVGVGWADSGTFRLETRFSGSTGSGLSGVFAVDTRTTADVMASLSGQVTDATGTPLVGAVVMAFHGALSSTGAPTDASGHYALPVLEAGTWEVWFSLAGYRTWVQSGLALAPGQARTLNVVLEPVPALPKVTASEQPVPKTQEAQIVPTTDTQLEVFNGTAFVQGAQVDRALPTVIFTHGWNSDPTVWAQMMATQMMAANVKANLLAWDWKTQADTLEPVEAMSSTRRQGEALGKALCATLGDSYDGTLHFIGHSLGTLVNATAANYLHGLRKAGVPQFPADHTQMTLLDDGGVVNALGKVVTFDYTVSGLNGSIASQVIKQGYVSPVPDDCAWIDNYISLVGGYHPEAVNVYLPKSLGAGDGVALHAYACAWYAGSVATQGGEALVGERFGFERTGWPGQFPTPVPFPLGASLSQDPLSGNSFDLLPLTEAQRLAVARTIDVIGGTGGFFTSAYDTGINWAGAKVEQAGSALWEWGQSFFRPDPATTTVPPESSPETTGGFVPLSPRIDLTTAGSTPPRQLTGPGRADDPATNPPPAVWLTLALPAEVRGLSFDFTLTSGAGGDDYLAFGINGTNRFALETRFMETNRTFSSGWIDVSEYAGQSVEFFFGVLGDVSTNVAVTVDGVRFYQAIAPRLELLRSGADIVLRWPADNGGFTLESAANLGPVADWSPMNVAPVVDAGFYSVTHSITDSARFFRLRQSD